MPASIIKSYYDDLKAGKFLAAKCPSCSGLTFPPTTMCEHCGSSVVDETHFSGRGKLIFVSHGIAPPPNPRFAEIAPYAYGHILLEEGVYVQGIVTNVGIDPAVLEDYFDRGPVDVVADVIEVQGLPILAFKVV